MAAAGAKLWEGAKPAEIRLTDYRKSRIKLYLLLKSRRDRLDSA